MPTNSKALRQKMQERRKVELEVVKNLVFPLPDLKGPGGNAFALVSQGRVIMKSNGLPDTMIDRFQTEAMSGDYEKVLDTIQTWFTVGVAETTYTPLQGDIKQYAKDRDQVTEDDWSQFDIEAQDEAPETDQALADYEAVAERDRKIAEVQDRINREVRADLGLADDDVVLVKIVKAKQ